MMILKRSHNLSFKEMYLKNNHFEKKNNENISPLYSPLIAVTKVTSGIVLYHKCPRILPLNLNKWVKKYRQENNWCEHYPLECFFKGIIFIPPE